MLDAIVERIKNPIQFKQDHPKKFGTNKDSQASRALIFDSVYDPYRGVVAYVKVDDGSIKAGDTVHLAHSEKSIIVTEV
ncbi:hypothetical protein KA037_01410 [Patescibacteria group bacterium]|nr:hypothetical protein [Patescibacteria group bacterium]